MELKKIDSGHIRRSSCQDEDFFHIHGEEFALSILAMQSYNESLLEMRPSVYETE